MIWLAIGGAGCLAVLVTATVWPLRRGPYEPRHVLAVPEEAQDAQAPEWGSMIWDEELALLPALPELAHEPDWREQTVADLAPEALDVDEVIEQACESDRLAVAIEMGWPDSQVTTDGSAPGWLGADPFSCHPWPGSGPGAALSSLTSGPDPDGGGGVPEDAHEPVRPTLPPRPAGERLIWYGDAKPRDHELERLADTGDIASAHLLADVRAFMRAQDDEARAYGSAGELGWHDFMQQYWADFAA